ncbi:YbaY family lipoprotein [uncultured Ferrimonas sp.]|uniref:YbaY family lipoprotein n=1 Tax=uncultured Ferrimonas sp. TaxID=432640 RepID=UPI00260CDB1D|nr:YbaY family lipoprotein [uncultured Ferrimonas sp.]
MKRLMVAALAAFTLAGCGSDEVATATADKQVSGEVVYFARIATPPGSQLLVQLHDGNGTLLGQQQQEVQGGPPFPYQVDYVDATTIHVSASLTFGDSDKVKFKLENKLLDLVKTDLILPLAE